MTSFADKVAALVNDQFEKLPQKGKPLRRSNGIEEWTTLAGIVVEASQMTCVSLATGVKAMPDTKLNISKGTVVHDSHAEILCIRGFNRFVLKECEKALKGSSDYISRSTNGKFEAIPGLKIHLYISEAPCGDSSLSNTVERSLDEEEWKDSSKPIVQSGPLRGREYFRETGLVRTKPGRRDSEITMSKSCSDKLSMRMFTSLILGPVSTIVDVSGFYLNSLIIPENQLKRKDFDRCFGPHGRLKKLFDLHELKFGQYSAHLFDLYPTSIDFKFSRNEKRKTSSNAIVYVISDYIPGQSKNEVILNGVKMGSKPFSGKGQSSVSRIEIYKLVAGLVSKLDKQQIDTSLKYLEFKKSNSDRLKMKQQVYNVLQHWVGTKPDDFELEHTNI